MSPWWLVVLVASGPEEAEFRVQADEAVCAWKEDCYGEPYGRCVEDAAGTWAPVDDSCPYQPDVARECLAGLEQLACPQELSDEDGDFGFPSACDQVWDCD